MSEWTRREMLKMTGAGVAAASVGGVTLPELASATAHQPRAAGWTHVKTIETLGQYWPRENMPERDEEQALWTTLMPTEGKCASPLAAWYLWFWTHDAPVCRLYVGNSPEGDFQPWDGNEGFCNFTTYTSTPSDNCKVYQPLPPPRKILARGGGLPHADRRHWSSGDVVWDISDGHFYATPHVASCGFGFQTTVVIRSPDGINWDFVNPTPSTPISVVGGAGKFDSYAIDYGRILRDYNGNVVRHNGDVIYFYRGTRKTATADLFAAGALRSPDWLNWTKVPSSGAALFDPNAGFQFGLGSALAVDGRIYLVMAVAEATVAATTMYLKESSVPGDPYSWSAGPGTLIYNAPPDTPVIDGGSYAVHNSKHYMTYRSITAPVNTEVSRQRVELISPLL